MKRPVCPVAPLPEPTARSGVFGAVDAGLRQAQPRPQPALRSGYVRFVPVATRWMDNDLYGHLNNVVYYSLFDTAVNSVLVADGGLDLQRGETIGIVVESGCAYFSALAFPEPVEVGVRVAHIGRTSARYELGVFAVGVDRACACGHFVHVFVDRVERRPVPIADRLLAVLQGLL